MNTRSNGRVIADGAASTVPTAGYSDRPSPPGRLKIMAALKTLLAEKEFVSITVADIAKTAGVTEALIYKYFGDKRDLLHQVLAEYLAHFVNELEQELSTAQAPLDKVRKLILHHISMYAHNRIFARILLVEVRNYSDYFNSPAYATVKHYAGMLLAIIKEGMAEGSIRQDVPAEAIREVILGGIEHACLARVIFGRDIDPVTAAQHLCEITFRGISPGPKDAV
jgi:TetR/AcrR family transcriptional regulator, fatty acid metabolism regulator protein